MNESCTHVHCTCVARALQCAHISHTNESCTHAFDHTLLRCVAVHQKCVAGVLQRVYRVLQCVAVCCSVLQCVAVCCSVLQCVAVCVHVSLFPANRSVIGAIRTQPTQHTATHRNTLVTHLQHTCNMPTHEVYFRHHACGAYRQSTQ